jgi:hypothetical protein
MKLFTVGAQPRDFVILGANSLNSFPIQVESILHKEAKRHVEEIIGDDIANGDEQKIHHILVSNIVAWRLFYEGTITPAHMENAIENEAEQSVTIPNVEFLGKRYTVVVQPITILNARYNRRTFATATIDKDGNIV